jgi:hypothetical protein
MGETARKLIFLPHSTRQAAAIDVLPAENRTEDGDTSGQLRENRKEPADPLP